MFIQKWIPLFNIEENPRYLIHPIHKVIGRIVSEYNREVTFDEMREHLFGKWWGKVSYERIDEALANKSIIFRGTVKRASGRNLLNLGKNRLNNQISGNETA